MSLLTNLVSAWELDEASGTRFDSHGSNDLTDNNTVGSGTGLVHGTAADFEADNSETLSHANNSSLQTGDIDFTFEAWVKAETLSSSSYPELLGMWSNADGQRDYSLFYHSGHSRFGFAVTSDGFQSSAVGVEANNLGAPSTGTWYQVIGWHDAANNQLGIAVNAGTPDTLSHSAGVHAGTDTFAVGGKRFWDGLIGPVRFWKRVLTSQERTDLYNGGAGLAYSSFGGSTYSQLLFTPPLLAGGFDGLTGGLQ